MTANETYNALKPKQRNFVDAYIETMNAAEAARRSGVKDGSAYQAGWRMLRNVEVRAAISERLEAQALAASEVLARLAQQATANIADFFVFDGDTVRGINAEYLQMHGNLVKKITVESDKIQLELYDGQAALVHLGRYHSLFVDKTDLTSGGEKIIVRLGSDE
jgi:phage terminase small subunit